MKNIFLLTIIAFSKFAFSQQTCEMQFHLIMVETPDSEPDTAFIDLAQTRKKVALNFRDAELEERFVLDSTLRKVVELTTEDGEKTAFLSDIEESTEDEMFGFTTAYDVLTTELLESEEYRLKPDKKTIQGWNCQQIEFLDEGVVYGTGWVALGLHIGIEKESGFFAVAEGSLIEFTLKDDELGSSLTLKLVKSAKTIANPAVAFSMEVPAGYELDTLEEYYYDDEEEGE